MNKFLEKFTDIFVYTLPRISKDIWFQTRMVVQRIFNSDHLCSRDAWECGYEMIRKMYPYVLRFKKLERHGCPCLDGYFNPETGEELKGEGAAIRAWESILDEIIFAFEWTLIDNGDKRLSKRLERKFKRLYGDWTEEIEENKKEMKLHNMKGEVGAAWTHYFNEKLYWSLSERAQKGFKLFGEHITGMWD